MKKTNEPIGPQPYSVLIANPVSSLLDGKYQRNMIYRVSSNGSNVKTKTRHEKYKKRRGKKKVNSKYMRNPVVKPVDPGSSVGTS